MKYFLAWLAGAALGGVLACIALYFNPFVMQATDAGARDWALRLDYSLPADDLLALTHAERAPLPFKPAEIGSLWESTVRSSVMAVLALEDRDSKSHALATLLGMPSPSTDLLAGGAIVEDDWLVTVPGKGSVFVQSLSNLWPFLKDSVLPVTVLGRPWRGPREYRPTVGPGPGRMAVVIGGTGQFAGRQGTAVERFRLERYSRAHGAEALAGELALRLADADGVTRSASRGSPARPVTAPPGGGAPPGGSAGQGAGNAAR